MAKAQSTKSTQSGIYAIRCLINGKVYIGSAINFYRRWGNHRRTLNKGIHHSRPLQRAWDKHGSHSFVFEIIEIVEIPDLIHAEQRYLDTIRPFDKNGYNICTTAGSALGVKRSPETKSRMSAAQIGRKMRPDVRNKLIENMNKPEMRAKISSNLMGHEVSGETRAKLSAALSGRKLKPETHAKIAAHLRTPENRARQSASIIGRKQTIEARLKQSAALKGKKKSEEHKAKISAAHRGKKASFETRAKLRAAWIHRKAATRCDKHCNRQITFSFLDED